MLGAAAALQPLWRRSAVGSRRSLGALLAGPRSASPVRHCERSEATQERGALLGYRGGIASQAQRLAQIGPIPGVDAVVPPPTLVLRRDRTYVG